LAWHGVGRRWPQQSYAEAVAEIGNTPLGVRWDRMRGWRDQYERMHRWHARLVRELALEASEGDWSVWPNDLWDTAMVFFQSAYHLKDWLLVDHPDLREQLEAMITADRDLALCADICNGTKHREVSRGHRVPTHVVGMREFAPDVPSQARWLVLGPDGPINLDIAAGRVLRAWDQALQHLPTLEVGRRRLPLTFGRPPMFTRARPTRRTAFGRHSTPHV
jgi:hypothetical protein